MGQKKSKIQHIPFCQYFIHKTHHIYPFYPSLIVLYCYPEESTQIIEFVTVRHSGKMRNQMYCKIVQHNLEQSTAEKMGKKGGHRFAGREKEAELPSINTVLSRVYTIEAVV